MSIREVSVHYGSVGWKAENLVLLHPVCHIQVHQNKVVAAVLIKSINAVKVARTVLRGGKDEILIDNL